MPLLTRIDLPAPSRPVGGLLAAARPLPAGWERGITFPDSWCLSPSGWPYCISDEDPPPDPKASSVFGDTAVYEPRGIFQGIECTTLSRDAAAEGALQTLEATRDWAMGQELADGAITGNPNLGQAVPVASIGTGIANALATAEGAAADGLYGRLAFIHVTWRDLTLLLAAQAVWRDGRTWRTAAGNTVVSSAGYDFNGTIHATGEVFAALSAVDTRIDTDRPVNLVEAYAEQIGLAAFAPCFNVSVEVT